MDNVLLYQKIMSLPENLRVELMDFLDSLKRKTKKEDNQKKPKFGSGKGVFRMKKGFDEPLDDFKDYM